MRKWWCWFWFRVLMLSANRCARTRVHSRSANRYITVALLDYLEVTLTVRDTREPDAYAPDELIEMLKKVREHERRQGWRVPEPRIALNGTHRRLGG
jgi:hypothetical protein